MTSLKLFKSILKSEPYHLIKEEVKLKKQYERVTLKHISEKETLLSQWSQPDMKQQLQAWKKQCASLNPSSKEYAEFQTELIHHVFAMVKIVFRRVLNVNIYDTQLLGALTLIDGHIAEMATGEGKTFVSPFAVAVKTALGKQVHVLTPNDYLAHRDYNLLQPVFDYIGIRSGINHPELKDEEKRELYTEKDVLFGTTSTFGFDYLRDQMVTTIEQKVNPEESFQSVIIDEADSILLDEARTPLIIADKTEINQDLVTVADQIVRTLDQDVHYETNDFKTTVYLTDKGITQVEQVMQIDNLYDLAHSQLYHHLIQSLRAHVLLKKDREYIVNTEEQKIELIDLFTGRILTGRTLSEGLHQAVEAKEGIPITQMNRSYEQTTVQNFIRLYEDRAGMSGTASENRKEFDEFFEMNVLEIPRYKPVQRVDLADRLFLTKKQKLEAIIDTIDMVHASKQPILIGTTSIIQSSEISQLLNQRGIRHHLLNAKNEREENQLIANAGKRGNVTIATNMAGRGTDIQISLNVRELGGLFVLGTEMHESARIDNQLRGRSGRQGDPGVTQFILSVEDDLIRMFSTDENPVEVWEPHADSETGEITNPAAFRWMKQIQSLADERYKEVRTLTFQVDQMLNQQRKAFDHYRDRMLKASLPETISYITQELMNPVTKHILDTYHVDAGLQEFDPETLGKLFSPLYTESFEEALQKEEELHGELDDYQSWLNFLYAMNDRQGATLQQILTEEREQTPEQMYQQIQAALVHLVNRTWYQQITQMNEIKDGMFLRTYGQQRPLEVLYQEGYDAFLQNKHDMEKELIMTTSRMILQLQAMDRQSKQLWTKQYTDLPQQDKREVERKSKKNEQPSLLMRLRHKAQAQER